MCTWIPKVCKMNLILLMVVVLTIFFINGSFGDAIARAAVLTPASIEIVSGDNQFGNIGTLLPEDLVVRVLNDDGVGLPFAGVTFTIISGGGTLSKGNTKSVNKITDFTDLQGKVSVKLTLGNTKEINQVRASVGNVTPVVFTETVLNSKPRLGSIGNKEVNEGATLRFTVSASDRDQVDVLTLSANPLPANATFDPSNGVFTFIPDYTQAGTYLVTFTVSDGTDIDSETITITVRGINRPPILNSIGPRTIDEGSELTIVVSATDPDNDTLTYSVLGIPTGATFNAVQRTFKWKPGYDIAPPGGKLDFQVTFIVKDPSGASDSEQITITVNDVVPLLPNIRVLPLIAGQPSLDFGTIQLDETEDRIFQIHNDGNNVLKLTNIATADTQFQLMTYIKTTSELVDMIDPDVLQMLDEATILTYLGAGKFEQVKHSPTDPLITIGYPDLNPGECLLIKAQFKPATVGSKTSNFIIRSNDPNNPIIFMALQGRAVQTPDIHVSPVSLDFGAVDMFKSVGKSLHISNDGNAILNITSITSDDPQFTISQYTNVNPHSEILPTVKFTPTSEGAKTTTLRISSNDPDTPVVLVNLKGSGIKVPGPDIDVSPTNLAFGDVEVGQSLSQNFLLKNLGDAVLQISDMTSSNSQFTVTKVTAVPPGVTMSISVRFVPASLGTKVGIITITSNSPGEPTVVISVQGNGVLFPAPNIRIVPTTLDFGNVEVGKTLTKNLNIYNDGSIILQIQSITSGTNQFVVQNVYNITPGNSVVVPVQFVPSSLGLKQDTITVKSNDPDEPNKIVAVKGTGISPPEPDIDISPTTIDYGSIQVGKSLVKSFQVKNVGSRQLTIYNITSNNNQFTVINDIAFLNTGESANISVQFLPNSAGLKTATVTVTSNDPDESSKTVTLQGIGVSPPEQNISITPTSIDFGSVQVGKSLVKSFQVKNTGSLQLTIYNITSNNNQFTVINDINFLNAGESANISVQFLPNSAGLKTATVTVTSNDPDESSKTVTLQGIGVSPPEQNISITPTSIDFGNVQVAVPLVKSFQVKNTGSLPLTIYSIMSNSNQFTVIYSGINILNTGESLDVSVRFLPASTGLKTATVTVTSNDPDESLKTVALQGNGFEVPVPDIDVFPTSIDFGAVEVGNFYAKNFSIYNRGNASLLISSMTSNDSQFSVINATSVPVGSSMVVAVRFTPTSVGAKQATITIVSNDLDEPSVTVSLYGEGVYPGFVDIGVWTPVQPPTFFYDLNDVFFTDNNNGWVVGYNGTIINTINSGNSWSLQPSGTSRSLNSVFFTDLNTGWVVGQYGTTLKTSSGGYLWSQLNSTVANTFRALKFVTPSKGWAVGESGTIMTVDNGFWSPQNSGTSLDLNDVSFASIYQGWIVGNYGTILKTIDGGQLWIMQTSGTTNPLYGVDFVNSYEGWVVGGNGAILHTQDGGQTWVPQNSNVGYATLTAVDFISSTTGWIVGSDGIILYTINGGTTWIRVDSGTTQTLRAVQFQTPDLGWAVGANGTILKYTPNIPTNINSVSVSGSPARTGGVIRVTAMGQPKNVATFSISGVVSNVSMREDTPGTYIGNYTVVDGVNVTNATVTVNLVNKYGNTATDTSQRVTIDTTALISSATVTPASAKFGDTITVTAYADPGATMWFTIETVIVDAVMAESTIIPGKYVGGYKVTQGINVTNAKVSVRMIDAFGNSAVKDAGQVSIDTTVQITSVSVTGSPAKLGDPIIIVMIGEPNGTAKFTIGDIAINVPMTTTQSGVYTGSFTAPKGTHVTNSPVTVQLTDALGNKATKDAGAVTIYTESRITNVTVSGSPGKAGGKITVQLVGDSNGHAKFSIAGIPGEQLMTEQPAGGGIYIGTYTIPSNVNINDATVTVTLVDSVGNTATDISKKVTIDNILPKINSVSINGSPARLGGKITVNMNGEPNGRARFNIGGLPDENMQEQPIGSGNYSGTYTVTNNTNINDAIVTVTLLDLVGNYVTDTSKTVTIDNTPPTINSVRVAGSPGKAGSNITVTMIGEPNGNAKFSITGILSDQSMAEQPIGSGTYSGIYTILNGVNATDAAVTVTLSDQAGNTSADSTQKVTVDTTPPRITSVSVSGSPAKVNEVITVTLVGEKGGIAQFSIAGVIQDVAMNESNPGTYTGKYTVVNDKGISNAVVTVTLKDSAGNLTIDTSKKVNITPSWDVDRDGTVGASDIIAIANVFGQKVSGKNNADINGDGIVNILDLVILADHFGESSIPASPGKGSNVSSENLSVLKNLYKSVEELQSDDPDVAMAKELLIRLIKSNTPQITESMLLQNYPNPFNPETWIPFRLSKPGTVTLSIYTSSGQLVRSIDLGYREMGDYTGKDKAVYWDGKNESGEQVSSGIYFYSIKAGDFTAIKKMIVKK